MRIPEDPGIDPFLHRDATIRANRPRRREARLDEGSLNLLHLPEVARVVEELVHLQRDTRAVPKPEPERGAHAAAEVEDLDGRGSSSRT